jgi:outer membrane protein assembly factor BamB
MARLLSLLLLAIFTQSLNGQATVTPPATPVQTWPQWRGPVRDGQVRDVPAWPEQLTGLKQSWRVAELGPSYSGPIVSTDMVFTTETANGKEEVVTAFNRSTGKQVWQVRWPGSMSVPFFAWSNGSWIRSTPAYDGKYLYVAGMRDVLVCLEGTTGQEKWRVDFVKEFKSDLPAFGFVCSPLVTADAVYVQAGAAVVKLNKENGQVIWKTLSDGGGMYGSAFSSPVIANIGGQPQLLVQTREKLAGVTLDNGTVLWSQAVEAFRGMNIMTPTLIGQDRLLTSTYGGRTELHQLSNQENKWQTKIAWSEKTQGYMSTPIIIGQHAYLHLRNQRFCCIDLEAGKVLWTSKPYGKYWSLVANQDKILALDERGELLLIAANPQEFKVLATKKISDDSTWAHLSVCGDELFIREQNALTAWRWSAE